LICREEEISGKDSYARQAVDQLWLYDQVPSQEEFLKGAVTHKDFALFKEWQDVLMATTEKGKVEGLKEGIEKGRVKEKLKIAKVLLKQGLSPENIQQATGLSLEQIKKMRAFFQTLDVKLQDLSSGYQRF